MYFYHTFSLRIFFKFTRKKGAGIVWFSSEMMILFCRSSTRFIIEFLNFILVERIDMHWMNKANTILYWKSIDRLIENLEKIIFLLHTTNEKKNHFQNCQLNVFAVCFLENRWNRIDVSNSNESLYFAIFIFTH